MTTRKVNSSKPRKEDRAKPTAQDARYQRLPTGAHGLTREQVELDQRERLRSAMIELIAQRGYPAVRILDLTQLAHVSRPTFYNLFADKEELLLSAYEDIAGRTTQRIAEAYNSGDSPEQSVQIALQAFAELAAAEPEAMTLALLGTFGAGPRALERRAGTLNALERIVEAGRAQSAHERPRDLTAKFLIGGIREVSAARLRQGRAEELVELAGELADWAASYPDELPLGVDGPPHARPRSDDRSAEHGSPRGRRSEGRLPSGRHDLPREEVIKSQRERIVDATAAIVAKKGFAGLTIPEIASRANISHETFYEIYETKHDAFLGAQKVGLHQALRVTVEAFDGREVEWPDGVAAGMHALLGYVASEPEHAHLTLVDTFGASPRAIEIREAALESFTAYLRPGYEHASSVDVEVPEIAAEAVAGGVWQIMHHYIEQKRLPELCDAAPQLVYLTLNPFVGSELAAEVARRPAV
jgi:AcrR family transcriptional regulator